MTNDMYLFLKTRANIRKTVAAACQELREAMTTERRTPDKKQQMVKADILRVCKGAKSEAEACTRIMEYYTHTPQRRDDPPEGEELVTVCDDGTRIYRFWDDRGYIHYRVEEGESA